jgi:phosphocarrier protein HPr
MIQQEVTILNRAGIHARPASLIVKTASKFKSNVYLEKDGMKINAKSIMGIITLGASHKTKLILSADGPDEDEMMQAISHLFESRFEEG